MIDDYMMGRCTESEYGICGNRDEKKCNVLE
jgi:hypothetical protein